MLLVAALLVSAASAATDNSQESSKSEGSSKLIKTLRNQLMRDNSDYSHEIPKESSKVRMRANPEPEIDELQDIITERNNYYVTIINQQRNYEQNREIKFTADENGSKKKPVHPVSEKDLFYYIDDEKLISKKPEDRIYKTIKVRHQYRRSGQSTNQYIQEEGEQGVAIVSLGKAPFPELRLPHSRRQYKHDHGAASTDDEHVPPPPVDDDEPAAAAAAAAGGEDAAVQAYDDGSPTGDQEDTVDVEKSTTMAVQKRDDSQLSLSLST